MARADLLHALFAVCPAGTVETSGGTCTKCPQGSYCPAGTGNGPSSTNGATSIGTTLPLAAGGELATSGLRSFQISCGLNMTTRLLGAKEELSCGKFLPTSSSSVLSQNPCLVQTAKGLILCGLLILDLLMRQ